MYWAAAIGALLTTAFVGTVCSGAAGNGASFAAALVALACAGATGPFLFPTNGPWRAAWLRGCARAGIVALAAVVALGTIAVWREGPFAASLAVGAFAGLYAWTGGALGHALGAGWWRCAVAVLAVLALTTLFFWDDWFLREAADRKSSAAFAFGVNPAAAAAVTLEFDWIHAKALYTNNETAESLVGIPLSGVASYAWKLAVLGVFGLGAAFARLRIAEARA